MSSTIPFNITIGSRIQVGKDRATVKFTGSVENSKGEWLGVEWDDPQRGKHDGTHQEKKYFECRYPTSGSFIRYHPEKVKTGICFIKALKHKYLDEDDLTKVREGEEYDPTKDHGELYFGGNKQIVVETVGFEKIQRAQRELSKLKVVGLAEQLIQSAGDENEISNNKLTIEDLDLSRNLISDWKTVIDIAAQLPCLTILRLNQLRFMNSPPEDTIPLPQIKTLALNQTMMTWNDIELVLKVFPRLEDLQLGANQLFELGVVQSTTLKCINLEHNSIQDWKQVSKLGLIQSLETLYLNDNQLKIIDKPSDKQFVNLKFLRIERNLIDNWDSLNHLNHFKSLVKLRCKENPIFKDIDKELEPAQIVGRIKNLMVVNGISLTNRERIDLERYYLTHCTKDGATHEEIGLIHPRYRELCEKHGEPTLQTKVKENSTALKNRLFNIQFTTREAHPDLLQVQKQSDLPPLLTSTTKKCLPTMTIRNTKNLIQRLLKVPYAQQHLYLIQPLSTQTQERDLIVMDITDDLRDLKFYAINDGDEILIVESI